MRGKRSTLPVRVPKIWFSVVVVLGGAAVLIFLGWLAISRFVMAKGDVPADATVRVVVGERSWIPVYRLELTSPQASEELGVADARLVKAAGELRFLTTSWWLHFTTLGEILTRGHEIQVHERALEEEQAFTI